MKTIRHIESRSRAASNGPLSLFAPLARAEIFPNSLLKNVTTWLDSLKSTSLITIASAFSVDTFYASLGISPGRGTVALLPGLPYCGQARKNRSWIDSNCGLVSIPESRGNRGFHDSSECENGIHAKGILICRRPGNLPVMTNFGADDQIVRELDIDTAG